MFKAITAAIGSLWSQPDEDADVTAELEDTTAEDEQSLNTATLEKQYSGKVTSLHSGYGLIDNDVYFNFAVIKGAVPRVGDTVRVIARRRHEAAGWRATKVGLYVMVCLTIQHLHKYQIMIK